MPTTSIVSPFFAAAFLFGGAISVLAADNGKIAPGARLEKLAGDLGFTEGPIPAMARSTFKISTKTAL